MGSQPARSHTRFADGVPLPEGHEGTSLPSTDTTTPTCGAATTTSSALCWSSRSGFSARRPDANCVQSSHPGERERAGEVFDGGLVVGGVVGHPASHLGEGRGRREGARTAGRVDEAGVRSGLPGPVHGSRCASCAATATQRRQAPASHAEPTDARARGTGPSCIARATACWRTEIPPGGPCTPQAAQ